MCPALTALEGMDPVSALLDNANSFSGDCVRSEHKDRVNWRALRIGAKATSQHHHTGQAKHKSDLI